MKWMASLPADVRPSQLCERYPSAANRIALCWNDPVLTGMVFNDLMMDRRGRRMGFPQPVAAELVRLRVFHDKRPLARMADSPWAIQSLALTDR